MIYEKKLQGLYLKTFCLLAGLLFISFISTNAQVHINHLGNYPTISAAVAVAPSGATINIDAKATPYTENVIVDKTLTFEGPNVGIPGYNTSGAYNSSRHPKLLLMV